MWLSRKPSSTAGWPPRVAATRNLHNPGEEVKWLIPKLPSRNRLYIWMAGSIGGEHSKTVPILRTRSAFGTPTVKHAYLTDEDSNDTKVTIEEISELEKKRGDTEPPIDWKPAEHQVKTLETLRQLNASVDRAESESRHGRPTIMLRPGKLPNATDRAENVLLDHSESFKIFQRAGELVRIISLPARQVDKRLRRPQGNEFSLNH